MAKPTKEERRRELEKEFDRYLSHRLRGQEAYEFNIKVGRIDIPNAARRNLDEDVINDSVASFMAQSLKEFAEELQRAYPWIHNWHQEGRSGGWLVLEPDYGILDKETGLVTLRQRLKDLERIAKQVKEGVRGVERTLESDEYWEVKKQDWSPRD